MDSCDIDDSLVKQRVGHIACSFMDSIIVWGGCRVGNEAEDWLWPSDQIGIFDPISRCWSSLSTRGDVPPLTSGATAVVHGNTLYVFFGFHHIPRLRSEAEDRVENIVAETSRYIEKNSNQVYALDIRKLTWTKMQPAGLQPLKVDKLGSWLFGDKVYLFGGFGQPLDSPLSYASYPSYLRHEVDFLTLGSGRTRGWTNQLVVYDIPSNSWQWPDVCGHLPSPRAAHSCAANESGDVYVFGGRHGSRRMNDLYHVNLQQLPLRWSQLQDNDHILSGRSWHSMTMVADHQAVVYGGYDNHSLPLGDCWLLDVEKGPLDQIHHKWTRIQHLEKGSRLWHSAVVLPHSQLVLVGGVDTDLDTAFSTTTDHADSVLVLPFAPPTLLQLAVDALVSSCSSWQLATFRTSLPKNLHSALMLRKAKAEWHPSMT